MSDAVLRDHETRIKRLEEWLPPPKPKKRRRHVDPKFRHILRQSMQEKGLNASRLAGLMFGWTKDKKGKKIPKGKYLLSVWLSGKNYPSDKHMALLAQFVDVV